MAARGHVASLQSQVSTLQSSLEQKDAELASLPGLQAQLVTVQGELNAAQSEVMRLTGEVEGLRRRCEELAGREEKLKEEVHELRLQAVAASGSPAGTGCNDPEHRRAEEALRMKEAEVEHHRLDAAALRDNAEGNHKLAVEKMAEVEALRSQVAGLQAQIQGMGGGIPPGHPHYLPPWKQQELQQKELEARDAVIRGLQETVEGYSTLQKRLDEKERECEELREMLVMAKMGGLGFDVDLDAIGNQATGNATASGVGAGTVGSQAEEGWNGTGYKPPAWEGTANEPFTVNAPDEDAKPLPLTECEREWKWQKENNGEENQLLDLIMFQMSGAQAVKQYFMKVKAKVDLLNRQGGEVKGENFHLMVSTFQAFFGTAVMLIFGR